MALSFASTLDQPEEDLYGLPKKTTALGTLSPTLIQPTVDDGAPTVQEPLGTVQPAPINTAPVSTPSAPAAPTPTPIQTNVPALSYGEVPQQATSYGTVAPSGPTDLAGGGMYASDFGTLAPAQPAPVEQPPSVDYGGTSGITNDPGGLLAPSSPTDLSGGGMYASGGTLAAPSEGYGTVAPGIEYGGTSGIINDPFGSVSASSPAPDPRSLIAGFYDQYLHRAPDEAGLESWLQAFPAYGAQGVEEGFRNSPEAQAYLAAQSAAPAPTAQATPPNPVSSAAPVAATPPYAPASVQAAPRDPNAILSALFAQAPATQPFTATADLRATQINPTASSATSAAQGMTDTAAQSLAGFGGLPGYSPVSATGDPYTARADAYSDEAAGMARSADIGPQQSIQGTDLTQSRGLLDQALGQVGGMTQGPRYNVAGTDLSGAYGTLDRAEQGLGGVFAPSAEATSARSTALGNLNSLNDAPNRAELAARAFKLARDSTQEGYDRDVSAAAGRMAAMGRIGDVNDESLQRLFRARQTDLDRTNEDMSLRAADSEFADRQGRLSAALGALGTFGGEDRSNYGVNMGRSGALGSLAGQRAGLAQITRGDNEADRAYNSGYDQYGNALSERRYGMFSDSADRATNYANTARANAESDRAYNFDYGNARASNRLAQGGFLSGLSDRAFGQGQSLRNEARDEQTRDQQGQLANLNARTGIFGSLANYQNQLFGQDAASRGELRGERGYQNDMAQQGFINAYNSAQLNDSLQNSAAGRYNDQTRLLMGAMGDPNALASALLSSSNQQSGTAQAGMTDIGQLLALWSQMQAGRSPTTTGSNTFPTSWAAGG